MKWKSPHPGFISIYKPSQTVFFAPPAGTWGEVCDENRVDKATQAEVLRSAVRRAWGIRPVSRVVASKRKDRRRLKTRELLEGQG